jgi:hypothetical protein
MYLGSAHNGSKGSVRVGHSAQQELNFLLHEKPSHFVLDVGSHALSGAVGSEAMGNTREGESKVK